MKRRNEQVGQKTDSDAADLYIGYQRAGLRSSSHRSTPARVMVQAGMAAA
jgi:hypothetical protein